MNRSHRLLALIALFSLLILPLSVAAEPDPAEPPALDYDIADGRFFTQTNGFPTGSSPTGFAVTNDGGVPFWDAFQGLGGQYVLGYPVTKRFIYDGFVTQAMQKVVFQWRPDSRQVWFLNTFDALHDKGKDAWLFTYRQTPYPRDTSPDDGLSWEAIRDRHLAFLDQNAAIKAMYLSDPQAIDHFGLPVAYQDMGSAFVVRAQRATFQYWKQDVPWAKQGDVTIANGGDLAKEAGLWPASAIVPDQPGQTTTTAFTSPISAGQSSPTLAAAATAAATATPTATVSPTPTPTAGSRQVLPLGPGVYQARSPEYGMNIFIWGFPATTQRDIQRMLNAGFGWQKTLFQWRQIEGAGKGIFDWTESDRVVKASTDSGVKIIARVDFQPSWARRDGAHNGPPDNYQDYADFLYALVSRYKSGSPYGRIHAVELWNEPNLAREWGNQKPDAVQYVRLLRAGYEGAKRADPAVTVITAGLTPTGTWNDDATPDDLFLQQMYDAGARNYFDVLGAHGAGYKAPPQMSPEQVAADPSYGGHRFFTFRRVEDLRNVMVKNGDSAKQIWLLEFGWTSDDVHPAYSWHRVTEDQKAQYFVDAYRWAMANWSPWIGVMAAWNLPSPDWGPDREEYWWAIANPDGSDRPAYTRLLQARQNGTLP